MLTKIGQGVVYGAPNVKTKFAALIVYKEYKAQARSDIDFNALAAMPALVEESLSYGQAERLISIAAWPCAIIEDAAPGVPRQPVPSSRTTLAGRGVVAEGQLLHPARAHLEDLARWGAGDELDCDGRAHDHVLFV
jgi:hypothetical protein